MRVLNDNVMVAVGSQGERTTPSGLYMPETAGNDGQVIKGVVQTVGDGLLLNNGQRAPMNVQVGDTVWFPKFNAHKIEIERKMFYVISESQIAIIE